jgi:hypothetical protein
MVISDLSQITKFKTLFPTDSKGRSINIYKITNSCVVGKNIFYPNTLLYSSDNCKLYNPINEKVMSLSSVKSDNKFIFEVGDKSNKNTDPIFFFIYNTENYFHFVYDSLPYLISYFELKKEIPTLKLLMNYPNKTKKTFYQFVIEFLNIIGITNDDIVLVDENTEYSVLYVSSSYTHGVDSNLPPRNEVYEFYNFIKTLVPSNETLPKKIYISRRTWLHNDMSNIGTNYTTRRKMTNEDRLVDYLSSKGFVEVFTEKLSTFDKIQLFSSVDEVVGSIGGGLCNVLFSKKECKLLTIVSPTFLNVNDRFKYSLNQVRNTLFFDTKHTERSHHKLFSRVRCGDIVGEIIGKTKDKLKIMYDESPVSGWNTNEKYNTKYVNKVDCTLLDNGLNSQFKINLNKFKKLVK